MEEIFHSILLVIIKSSSFRSFEEAEITIPHEPSISEIAANEEYLINNNHKLKRIRESLNTLDGVIIDDIVPGSRSNPVNVKRVEFILPEEDYDTLFSNRHFSYSYKHLLQVKVVFRDKENSFISYTLGSRKIPSNLCHVGRQSALRYAL